MSKNEEVKMVYIRLRDRGSVFHDRTQENGTVAGEAVAEMMETARVAKAIRAGHVQKVSRSEYDEWVRTHAAETKKLKVAKAASDEGALAKAQADIEEAAKKRAAEADEEDGAAKKKAAEVPKKKAGQ